MNSPNPRLRGRGRLYCKVASAGFTLMEVMVALFIMAMIAMLASQAFNTAASGAAATREAMDRLAAIDRTLFIIESDLRNAVPKTLRQRLGETLPALYVAVSDDYWLTVMRGGMANPLNQRRTEEVRVGYRYIEETIWRDTWYNPVETEQDEAQQQKLLDGVTNLIVRVLPSGAGGFDCRRTLVRRLARHRPAAGAVADCHRIDPDS
ncbi:MAG: type II secretion system minor pseudopilin GspJ [Cellvibrionaceae bacterium]|nr:type II secretion system minor pseudopilin GspJ [Cellvibrionaceae bacterium]